MTGKYTVTEWRVHYTDGLYNQYGKQNRIVKGPFKSAKRAAKWLESNMSHNWGGITIRARRVKVSTNDVPGARKSNRDELAAGCWAEHKDGSLIFVEGSENGTCVYSVFDFTDEDNPIEYRDAMKVRDFKKTYSWKPNKKDRWTWHDKTAFPWEKIIELGAKDGVRYPSADRLISAAARVAESRNLTGDKVVSDKHKHKVGTKSEKAAITIMKGIQRAIEGLAK